MTSPSPYPKATTPTLAASLTRLAALTHANADLPSIWSELSSVLAQQFGHSLFTILTYSPTLDRVVRVYSTRPDLHPLGVRRPEGSPGTNEAESSSSPPPQRQAWIKHVLVDGETWRGSTKEDLKAVFEDWELLWSVGLGSVLNVPVRHGGKTIGSLNILDKEHKYDDADLDVGILITQMVAIYVDMAGRLSSS